MDINSLMQQLGNFGRYQLFVYILSCVPPTLAGIVFLSTVFLTATPKHRCFIPHCDVANSTYYEKYLEIGIPESDQSCKRYTKIGTPSNYSQEQCSANLFTNLTESCHRFVFANDDFSSTVVSEYDKVCSDSWQISLGQSVFYFGVLSGALLFGTLADRYGRIVTFKLAPIIGLGSALLSAFSPNFIVFTLSSAVTAACSAGMYQTAFIIGTEFLGGQYRVYCGNFHQAIFAVGSALLGLTAYYVREWRKLQLIIAITMAPLLIYPWLVLSGLLAGSHVSFNRVFPESVRWQVSKGQTKRAMKTIRTAAKWNKVNIPTNYFDDDGKDSQSSGSMSDNSHDTSITSSTTSHGPLDLLKNPITRVWTFNLFGIWLISSMVFYGLSFQASNIGSNIYMTFILLSLVEVPGDMLATYAMQKIGRKKVLFITLCLGGLSCAATAVIPNSYSACVTALAIFGKSQIAAAFSLCYVYSVEIFPTVLRSSGLGMCNMCSRIGSILAPQLLQLSVFGKSIPLLVCGVLSILASLLVIKLPETLNRKLPETLDDVKYLKMNIEDGDDIENKCKKENDNSVINFY